jgi:hypothetical protein
MRILTQEPQLINISIPITSVYTHVLIVLTHSVTCKNTYIVLPIVQCYDSITFEFNPCDIPMVVGTYVWTLYLQNSAVNINPALSAYYYTERLLVRADICVDNCL